MSTLPTKKLSIGQKCVVGFVIFFFIIGLIVGGVLLFTSFNFGGFGGLIGMGLVYGGIYGSAIVGSYVNYRFDILNNRRIS